MTRETPAIVVIGATGFTGQIIARAVASGDTPFVLAARDPDRLRAVADAAPGGATAVVDVLDDDSLQRLLRPGDAVINTAGPFTELGEPVVRACIQAGAHYLDTSGEQPWMHSIHERYDRAARDAGVSVVNAMAFEYALGDCALALAAEGTDPVQADMVYAWDAGVSSRGTRRTVIRMLGRPGLVFRDGRYRSQPQAALRRTVQLESGSGLPAVSFQCGEIVTGPRYLPSLRTARGWLVMGRFNARVAPWIASALPATISVLRPLLEWIVTRSSDPTDAQRAASHFTIRVELSAPAGETALEVQGSDPYGVTAEVAILGARRAMTPDAARGVLAPSRLVSPRALFDALETRGIRLVAAHAA